MPAVGIDLGTTYSCVAVMRNGKVEIIQNERGSRTTPSCVAFAGEERLVGEAAKHQMARNPENTVYDVKRLIGQVFSNPAVQTDMKRWAFKVTEDEKKPKISVSFKGKNHCLFPEEVSSTVLESMKKTAEDFIGEKVSSAVITVPAYFSDAQRRTTKEAAAIAGLHVLGMINEPTAAAIAYGLANKNSEKRNVLIYDLGGGTFDVTILAIVDKIYDVKATGGDTHLGGQDFNERLFSYFVAEFTRQNNVDIKTNQRSVHRLRDECEKAKKQLSSANRTSVQIDSLFNGIDFDSKITRAKFEQLNDDLFRATMETVGKVLEDANMDKKEIDDVVLVGGSTRIPCIQEMLEDYFGEEKVCKTVNPDEAVACGAAVQAAFLSSDTTAELNGMELNDVTPLSLGVQTKGEIMTFFVKRNTTIPTTKTQTLVTIEDYQTSIRYSVYEGERSMTTLNKHLGSFTLHGIPELPAGEGKTDVTFDIDANGVLNVSAKEKTTGKGNNMKITWDEGRLSEDVIQRMIQDAEKFRLEDDLKRKTAVARNDLESLAHKGQKSAQNKKAEALRKKFVEIIEWMEENENATLEVIEAKRSEVEDAYSELS